MNARKNNFEDVLDPFEITTGWFHVELVRGRIYPDPELTGQLQKQVRQTITQLGLDDRNNREMWARHFQEYCEKLYPEKYLKRGSPLVWAEAHRQGLLETEGRASAYWVELSKNPPVGSRTTTIFPKT